jgi:hypothetical protein
VIGAIQHHGTDASVQGRGAAALGMLAHRGGDSLKRTHYSDVL